MIRTFILTVAFEDEAGKEWNPDGLADEMARIIKEGHIKGDYRTYEIKDAQARPEGEG